MSAEIAITASVISAPPRAKRNPAIEIDDPSRSATTRAGDLAGLGAHRREDRDIERPPEKRVPRKEMRHPPPLISAMARDRRNGPPRRSGSRRTPRRFCAMPHAQPQAVVPAATHHEGFRAIAPRRAAQATSRVERFIRNEAPPPATKLPAAAPGRGSAMNGRRAGSRSATCDLDGTLRGPDQAFGGLLCGAVSSGQRARVPRSTAGRTAGPRA